MIEENPYCFNNREAYMQGTRDDETLKRDHSYIIYEVWRCTDDNRVKEQLDSDCTDDDCETVDPICASEEEIDEWIYSKRL